MRVLACVGDATATATHGGLPYHLLAAGKLAGFIDAGWPLAPDRLKTSRLIWNAKRLLTHGERGGYQYTAAFLEALHRQVPTALSGPDEIVSIFPLLPSSPKRSRVSFYIDATLKENFDEYGMRAAVGPSLISDALAREREAYHLAARVLCRSRTAAKTVVEYYGLDARNVHIVPGGANLPDNLPPPTCKRKNCPLKPLRVSFIGKDWQRKNLPFVLKVADVLHARGIAVEVHAIGFDPVRAPRHPRLRALGFVDKKTQMQKFVDFLGSCHFHCLFSTAEAFGLSNRESLRVGVPVLAREIGGIPDTVPEGCGHLFPAAAGAEDVADLIQTYVRDPERYWALRDAVLARSHEFSWAAAVSKMQAIWSGSDEYSGKRLIQRHE